MDASTAREGRRRLRHQAYRRRVVADGKVVVTLFGIGAGAVRHGGGIARRQHDGAIEVLDGLVGIAERQKKVAAVVVDRRILGEELRRAVEILDGELGLPEARVGYGAIVEDGGAAVVGECRVLQGLGVARHRLPGVTTHKRRGGVLRLQSRIGRRRQGTTAGQQHRGYDQDSPSEHSQLASLRRTHGATHPTARIQHRALALDCGTQ